MEFSIAARCSSCQGKGTLEAIVHTEDVMLMVLHNVEDGTVEKIPAIKQVRDAYGMGLKAAKELVEGAMEFYYAIQRYASAIPTPEDARQKYKKKNWAKSHLGAG